MVIVIDGKTVEHEKLKTMTHNDEINLSKQFDESYHRNHAKNHDR